MDQAMKHINRIAFTLAAFALAIPAAFAQGTTTQATTSTVTSAQTSEQTAEQREKARLEAGRKAAAADLEWASTRAKQDLEKAQRELARVRAEAATGSAAEHRKDVEKAEKQLLRAMGEERASREALTRARGELELYAKGTAALDTARYEKALEAFAEAAALKGLKEDSALYWKAFSEYKVQAMQAALESLKEVQKNFPDSRWLEQALALELEVKGAMGKPVSPAATPDEELKLLALNSLLNTDAEQALPMLEKMINSQQSVRLKKRALFVVSQSESPRAKGILASVASGATDPDLQLQALKYLQMIGGADDKKVLSDVYAASKDRDVKLSVVDSLYAQGDANSLIGLARKETDPAMRKRIVERLSRMKSKEATDYMLEIINK